MAARTLYRSTADRRFGGVCAGIAETYDLDPNVVRIAVVTLALVTAIVPVSIAYFVAWMMLPERPPYA